MRPSISVLITYYNERQLLTECLQSIAQQTDPHHGTAYCKFVIVAGLISRERNPRDRRLP